jgi:DNA-binding NarL/FixJ family response regulator
VRGGTNGKARIGVLVVRNQTRLFADVLAEALKRETELRLLSPPLTFEAALEFCRQHHPDVVVIEATELPAASLRPLVRPIRGACDAAPVLLVADETIDDEFFVAGLEAGASGILDASSRIQEVVKAVRAAAAGQRIVDTQRLANAVEGAARSRENERKRTERLGLLSDREREVLSFLVRGLRNSEIAERLTISPRTVEKHVHHILGKLEVNSRLAAAALALELGEVSHEVMRGTA